MNTSYIEDMISALYPERKDYKIEGQHPDLETFKQWYNGVADFHTQERIVEGIKTKVVIKHSGIAKMFAEKMATSFMNEKLEIIVPDDKGNDKLQELLIKSGLNSRIGNFTEKYFALSLGGIVAMPKTIDILEDDETQSIVVDPSNEIKISTLDALRFIPVTVDDEGNVVEAAIIKESTNEIVIQLHMLVDGVYEISEAVGKKNNKEFVFDFTKAKRWNTKQTTALFQAWYPQVVDNKHLENRLSTSMYADALDEFEAFDMTFDKFYTEFKNGGKKRFISADLITITPDGTKELVLGEEDVFLPPSKSGDQAPMINEHTSDLRVDQFIRGESYWINLAAKKCGLGDNAFEIDANGRPLQTATAAILKNQEAKQVVRKNERFAEEQLKRLCMAIKFVYNTFIEPNGLTYEKADIQISFDDNIIEDTSEQKKNDLNEVNAGTMTITEFRSKWYDEDYETADKFVKENGLLATKYLDVYSIGAMTPEKFCEIVYGNQDAVEYMKAQKTVASVDDYNIE